MESTIVIYSERFCLSLLPNDQASKSVKLDSRDLKKKPKKG